MCFTLAFQNATCWFNTVQLRPQGAKERGREKQKFGLGLDAFITPMLVTAPWKHELLADKLTETCWGDTWWFPKIGVPPVIQRPFWY